MIALAGRSARPENRKTVVDRATATTSTNEPAVLGKPRRSAPRMLNAATEMPICADRISAESDVLARCSVRLARTRYAGSERLREKALRGCAGPNRAVDPAFEDARLRHYCAQLSDALRVRCSRVSDDRIGTPRSDVQGRQSPGGGDGRPVGICGSARSLWLWPRRPIGQSPPSPSA
jgi:hypothetical protein